MNLTYKGKDAFRSFSGGFVSVLIYAITLSMIEVFMKVVILKEKSSFSINQIQKGITNDNERHYFAKENISFAIKQFGPNLEIDKSYFSFEIKQVSYIKTNSSLGFNSTSTSIEYEYWNNRFPHVDKAIYDRIGFQSYLCPKNSDFFVRANYNSENYELVQVNLYKWSGSNCKSDAEINDVINSHYIDIGIISTYFDFNDYTNPVKYYLQDDNYIYLIYNLVPEMSQYVNYYILKNTAFLNDDIFFGSQGSSSYKSFYSIGRKESILANFKVENWSYVNIYMVLDQKQQQYYRSVYSIFDMWAYIGGFFGLLKTIGGMWVKVFEQRAFSCSIFRELYQVEEQQNEVNGDEHFCEIEEFKERSIRKIHAKESIGI